MFPENDDFYGRFFFSFLSFFIVSIAYYLGSKILTCINNKNQPAVAYLEDYFENG